MTFGEGTRRRSSKPSRRASEPAPELTRQKLEQLALAYLNRFDCTAKKLAQKLALSAKKLGGPPEAAQWIAELVERYQISGVLNDQRFAQHLSSQLGARGKSARAISQKLSARGVPSELTGELMSQRKQEDPGAELAAARTYVRKRRFGPFRAPDERAEHKQKDLAALARQGFSFETARQALAVDPSADEE